MNKPYQPLLLKIIHNLQGFFVILAIATAIWTYNTYDGRWGKIFLPDWKEIEGIHGTFGLFSLLIFPFFILYAFHRGGKKLVQNDTLKQLKVINKPIWWYSLHRLTNTFSLFALTFAFFSGKMMDEKWLPKGELNHFWYFLHLYSLLVVVFTIALHILMNVKIGGFSLILSILNYQWREKDNPQLWLNNIKDLRLNWHTKITVIKLFIIKEWQNLALHFQILESTILLIILIAWLK
ncbi:cytochrome b/b6 domain-containing protein [Geminocystis sp. GBBB08]|uniref:cytochrome b/b6 domain-containing protein n=1 Tax=Geminocystis sp. GBBB08 TaxID=2604140 RepID=UPI0027E2CFA4|nr:cytochrome b/b6 domain-containing protein [Geminocystis sp. GBBB08]MBL1209976.1 cytochrome b/b6 domain-containing protein [Geminocystis sp. GBBB08]